MCFETFPLESILNVNLHIFLDGFLEHCISAFQMFFSTKGGFYSEGSDAYEINKE